MVDGAVFALLLETDVQLFLKILCDDEEFDFPLVLNGIQKSFGDFEVWNWKGLNLSQDFLVEILLEWFPFLGEFADGDFKSFFALEEGGIEIVVLETFRNPRVWNLHDRVMDRIPEHVTKIGHILLDGVGVLDVEAL